MRCPQCRGKSHVLRSDPSEEGTRRRRECLKSTCGFRWTTVESSADHGLPSVERPEGTLYSRSSPPVGRRATGEPVPLARAGVQLVEDEVAAAVANVAMRKREISRSKAAAEPRERQEDDGSMLPYVDRAPARIGREEMRDELGWQGFDGGDE